MTQNKHYLKIEDGLPVNNTFSLLTVIPSLWLLYCIICTHWMSLCRTKVDEARTITLNSKYRHCYYYILKIIFDGN